MCQGRSESCDVLLKPCFLFLDRTYHRVIVGEHDKGYGSDEDVQVVRPAKVRTRHHSLCFQKAPFVTD